MKTIITSIILFTCVFNVHASEKSPFTDIFFDQAPSVLVEVNNKTYYLLNINGVRRAEIINRCQAQFGSECECMLAEKFTEMMDGIGLPVADSVSLGLYVMSTHQVLNLENHPVTSDNAETLFINRTLRNEACY